MIRTYIITVTFYLVLFSPIINECTQYDCYDEDDCRDTHLTCVNHQQCIINCNGHRSCLATTIQCPLENTCTINCMASNTESFSICKSLIINATLSTLLTIHASANFDTLRSAIVYCPLKGKCKLNGYGTHIMTHMDIYALQGFRDVSIDCEHCHLHKIFCTEHFSHYCYIDTDTMQCTLPCQNYNVDQTCNNYKYYTDYENAPVDSEETPQTADIPSDTPSIQPSKNPTPLPTSPNTIICPDTIQGEYNGEIMEFEVQMPFNGNIIFDATNSDFDIQHLKAFNNHKQIANEHNTKILSINDINMNNYIFKIKGHTNGIYDITITCQSNNPTIYPSLLPSETPSVQPSIDPTIAPSNIPSKNPTYLPTNDNEIICPDTITGQYNGGIEQFDIQMPYNGALKFDASHSDFNIQLKAFENNNGNIGKPIKTIASNILILNDINRNNYIFTVNGNTNGIYNIIITCQSNHPTVSPSINPSIYPTNVPTLLPSINPSNNPTKYPSINPSKLPSETPSNNPSKYPSNNPSETPSNNLTKYPSINPSKLPSETPSNYPSKYPSNNPSKTPSNNPTTLQPSNNPSLQPTNNPSIHPTISPTNIPSLKPTKIPTSPDTIICPDNISGDYNGDILQFEIQIPFNGDVIFDASDSEFDIKHLKAFENDNGNKGMHIKTTHNNILTLTDISMNNYIFTMNGITNGMYNIIITCQSDSPTISPSINPSILPTISPSNNGSVFIIPSICDHSCENTIVSDIITIQITFEFEEYVFFNKHNLDCFMHDILFEYFNQFGFEWIDEFTVCNIEIKSITGGNDENINKINIPCNGQIPCFMNTILNILRRRRLQIETDGSISITIIDTQNKLETVELSDLEYSIKTIFQNRFGINLGLNTKINEELILIDNEKALPPEFTENKHKDELMGHFSGTRSQRICVGIFLSILGILFPFEMYYTYKYWSNRFSPYIHSRHPILNTWTNLIASLFLIIERPMHAIHRLNVYNALWFQWLRLLFYFISMQLLLGLVILRFWLLLFDIKWNKSMKNKEWKRQIDCSLESKKKSFWRRSHKTWGNYKFVLKYVITFTIALSGIPMFLVFWKNYFYGAMAHGIIIGIGTLLLYLLWKKTPIYADEFKIMSECGFVITWLGVAILCDILISSLKIIYTETFWVWFLSYSIPFLLLTGVIFIQSYWVLLAYKKSKRLFDVEDDDNSPISRQNSETVSLYDVLSDKLGCYEFIAHLLKEFSCENILSVIEMTQYKQFYLQWKRYVDMDNLKQIKHNPINNNKEYIISDIDYTDDDDDDDLDERKLLRSPSKSKSKSKSKNILSSPSLIVQRFKSADRSMTDSMEDLILNSHEIVDLPKNLPLSTIVWEIPLEMITIQDIIKKIQLLYEKYIKLGCELELNISFKLRREITKKYNKLNDDLDEQELYVFFDDVIDAMIKLMKDSYTRFRMTKGFIKYENDMIKRKNSNRSSIKLKIKQKLQLTPNPSVN